MSASPSPDAIVHATLVDPVRPRRWFQFSLGSMLAAATLASGILAVITLGERGRAPLVYSVLGVMIFRATRPPREVAWTGGAVTRFWRRQFVDPPTPGQLAFDVLFGVLLPLFCLWGDYIVFKGPLTHRPPVDYSWLEQKRAEPAMLGRYAGFVYALTAVQVSVLLVWMVAGRRLRALAGIIGGILLCGSTTALLLGVVLFPLATAGLMLMLTGALGYTPLLAAFVYYRQGRHALGLAQSSFGRLATIVIAGAAGALVIENLWMRLTGPAPTSLVVIH